MIGHKDERRPLPRGGALQNPLRTAERDSRSEPRRQDDSRPSGRKMRLISFRPVVKGSLRGFATVGFPVGPGELQIADCPVHVSHGRPWAALPARPVLDGDGRHVRPDGGKPQYAAILRWRDRDLADRWSDAVVALVRGAHPDALDEGEQ
jgi:hypothetical protein